MPTTDAVVVPKIANVCCQCKRARIVLIVYTDGRQMCGSCYSDGAFHAKIGSKQFGVPEGDSDLPAPGSHAGTSPSTGQSYTYTDQVIDMKTGERRPRR